MTLTVSFHRPERADHRKLPGSENDTLEFTGADGEYIALFVPPHVAAHTAAAFNRAMQAVQDGKGWTYTTKSGVWHISRDQAMGSVYLGQHEDVTGDKDPYWLFADGKTLIGCMDEIDAIEDENACTTCHALFGDLTEAAADQWLCDDCLRTAIRREVELAEMADDDRAHAMMERRAGL